eukprot:521797-Alexandrium_andersonii.AAC.1
MLSECAGCSQRAGLLGVFSHGVPSHRFYAESRPYCKLGSYTAWATKPNGSQQAVPRWPLGGPHP